MIHFVKSFPKAVVFLSLASLFGDIASETIYPLLPIYLTQVLGFSALSIGLLEGFAEAVASSTKVLSGYLNDRTKKGPLLVLVGYSISLTRSLVAIATSPWHIFCFRFADRLGKGIRTPPRDAWLASYTTPKNRGKIFGFHRAMDNVGATVAPLLASCFLFFFPGEYRILFLLTLIPGALVIFYIYKAAHEPIVELNLSHETPKMSLQNIRDFPRSYWYFLIILFVFTLSNSADAFLLLRMREVGVPDFLLPALWSALNIVKVLSTLWGGSFSDRVGPKKSILLGWMIYASAYFGFAFVGKVEWMVLIFIGYGIFFGLTEAPEKSVVTHLVPEKLRGTAFGFYHLVTGLGLLPASFLCGVLWNSYGSSMALLTGAVLSLLAGFLLLFFKHDHHNR